MAISNKYKNNLDDLINSSNLELLDHLGPINKGSRNMLKSENNSMELSE